MGIDPTNLRGRPKPSFLHCHDAPAWSMEQNTSRLYLGPHERCHAPSLPRSNTGDPAAAEQLLPLVYDELRKLAAVKARATSSLGQTLQATALVHEAYVATGGPKISRSSGTGAGISLRRLLSRCGGFWSSGLGGGRRRSTAAAWLRVELSDRDLLSRSDPEEILALNDALDCPGPRRIRGGRAGQAANLRRLLRRGGRKAARHVASNRLSTLDLRAGLAEDATGTRRRFWRGWEKV
jgi:hypothetical protein